MKRNSKTKDGYALATLVIFTMVAMVLGSTLLFLANSDFLFSIREENRIQAYYTALAGVESTVPYFDSIPNWNIVQSLISANNSIDTSSASVFKSGEFRIWFEGDKIRPVIHSKGNFKTASREISLELKKKSMFEAAVTVTQKLDIKQPNSFVYGDVQPVEGAILDGYWETNITGKVFDEVENNFLTPVVPDDADDAELIDFVTDDIHIYEIEVDGTSDVYIENIEVNADETINITGNGMLNLYCNSIDFKGTLEVEDDVTFSLMILEDGVLEFQSGDASFEGFIYAPTADLTFKANVENLGAIVARNLFLESGADTSFSSSLSGEAPYPEEYGFPSRGYSQITWRNS